MPKYSPPAKSRKGTIVIRPLRGPAVQVQQQPAPRHASARAAKEPGYERIARAKILRDIAILAVLALTILAGSAVLIGTLWREVSLAETEARIVEVEQAAKVRMAEIDALVGQQAASAAGSDLLILGLAGLGLILALVCLLRPTIILGR